MSRQHKANLRQRSCEDSCPSASPSVPRTAAPTIWRHLRDGIIALAALVPTAVLTVGTIVLLATMLAQAETPSQGEDPTATSAPYGWQTDSLESAFHALPADVEMAYTVLAQLADERPESWRQ